MDPISAVTRLPVRLKSLPWQSVEPVTANGLLQLPKADAVRPVAVSASIEAVVKGQIFARYDEWHKTAAITERPLEVDGLKLDGIPFVDDEAVLLDDLPLAEPEDSRPVPSADGVDTGTLHPPLPFTVSTTGQDSSAAAARGYHHARLISGLQEAALKPELDAAETTGNHTKPPKHASEAPSKP